VAELCYRGYPRRLAAIPVGGKLSLLPEGKLPDTPITSLDESMGGFITVDPSGYIAVHLLYAPNHYQVREIDARVMNPGQCIESAFKLADKLQWHLQEAVKHLPLEMQDIEIHELKTGRRNKTSRIRAWIKALLEGSYSIHKDAKPAIMYQALGFRIERTDNKDDILDVCAYGLDVRRDYHDIVVELWGESKRQQ